MRRCRPLLFDMNQFVSNESLIKFLHSLSLEVVLRPAN